MVRNKQHCAQVLVEAAHERLRNLRHYCCPRTVPRSSPTTWHLNVRRQLYRKRVTILNVFIRGILRRYIPVERRELLRSNSPTTDALVAEGATAQEAARVSNQQLVVCQQSLVQQNARCLELQPENAALSESFKKHANELSAQVTICCTVVFCTIVFCLTDCGVLLQIEKSAMMATQRERSRALHFETRQKSQSKGWLWIGHVP